MSRSTTPAFAWAGFLLALAARGVRGLVLSLLVISMIPVVSSWTGYVVRSGSMEPGLSVGDVVLARPTAVGEPVPVGRVMVFDNPDATSPHDVIVHRVVAARGHGTYTTAGDANRDDDSTPVPAASFTGRPSIAVPLIGLPLTWWADRAFGPLMLALGLAALVLGIPGRRARHRRPGTTSGTAARTALVLVPLVAMTAAVVGSPAAPADAAFTSSSTSRASTWSVAASVPKILVLEDTPDDVRGVVPLVATLNEASGRAFAVRIEYAPAGTTTWRTICSDSAAPYTCSWTTTGVANGDYDLRAVATTGTTTYTSALVEDVTVDNLAPTVTMQDPGTPLRGTVTTSATATDAHSGVTRVVIQYAATGSSTFRDVCTVTDVPYSCRFDTTTVPGGSYSFRAVATDAAGNATTSATVANRVVDNTVASVSVEDPGPFLSGTVPVTTSASSSAGIASVRIQRATAGTTAWTDICTDTTAPYSCSWVTTGVADGSYDLRAVMLDNGGRTTTSATVTNRRVDNSPMRGADVQTANGGSTIGRMQSGDSMTLTFTQQATLTSITPGWTGAALPVTVRLRDGSLVGAGSNDTVTVLRSGAAVNLGAIDLKQSYIKSLRTAEFAATMTAGTTTVNGVTATRVTITIGAQTSGSSLPTVSTPSVMVWTPSTLATNLTGRAASTTPTSETGVSDREF